MYINKPRRDFALAAPSRAASIFSLRIEYTQPCYELEKGREADRGNNQRGCRSRLGSRQLEAGHDYEGKNKCVLHDRRCSIWSHK